MVWVVLVWVGTSVIDSFDRVYFGKVDFGMRVGVGMTVGYVGKVCYQGDNYCSRFGDDHKDFD